MIEENTRKPYVSVIMAAFNAELFISQAIESILGQTYDYFELIIINDGSTDKTAKIIDKYKDGRITLIAQCNKGQTLAKNAGLKMAKGDFIAFCDADDIYVVDKIEKQVSMFVKNLNIGVIYTDILLVNEENIAINEGAKINRFSGKVLEPLLFYNFVPFGSAMIRRECIDEVGGFNDKYSMGIDWDLWLRISLNWEFMYMDEKLYTYRCWSGQMSSNYDGRYYYAQLILKEFYKKNFSKISSSSYRKARADNFSNHAYHIVYYEGMKIRSILLILKALFYGFDNIDTYRRVARTILRRF